MEKKYIAFYGVSHLSLNVFKGYLMSMEDDKILGSLNYVRSPKANLTSPYHAHQFKMVFGEDQQLLDALKNWSGEKNVFPLIRSEILDEKKLNLKLKQIKNLFSNLESKIYNADLNL